MTNAATLDRVFDALANESRRLIVAELGRGPATTPELRRQLHGRSLRFAVSKQAFSKHLQILESAGLVERERQGRTDQLRLDASALNDVTSWVGSITEMWRHNLDRLDRVLTDDADREEDG